MLTYKQRQEIYQKYRLGSKKVTLANEYCVTCSVISNIIKTLNSNPDYVWKDARPKKVKVKKGRYYSSSIRKKILQLHNKLKQRCFNKKSTSYQYYGGRGIIIEGIFLDSELFYQWCLSHGYESGKEIDRIDTNGNYSPENCRFVDKITNNRNKRNNKFVTIYNETKCLKEWSEDSRCVVSYVCFRARIYNGWNPHKALTTIKTNRGRKKNK